MVDEVTTTGDAMRTSMDLLEYKTTLHFMTLIHYYYSQNNKVYICMKDKVTSTRDVMSTGIDFLEYNSILHFMSLLTRIILKKVS